MNHFPVEVYRILKSRDLITSAAYVVPSAAEEFQDKTTRPNQLWQTDLAYLKVIGWAPSRRWSASKRRV